MLELIFKQENKSNWQAIKCNLISKVNDFENIKNDFVVRIEKYSPKKSNQQLRSYWMLVNSVKKWMQEQGNNFTQEEVSYWFKIRSRHVHKVMDKEVPRSISNKSTTTKDEMRNLINVILEFGLDNQIKDCYIEPKAFEELLTFYR